VLSATEKRNVNDHNLGARVSFTVLNEICLWVPCADSSIGGRNEIQEILGN
jgi:hypothetical protein